MADGDSSLEDEIEALKSAYGSQMQVLHKLLVQKARASCMMRRMKQVAIPEHLSKGEVNAMKFATCNINGLQGRLEALLG